jgi:hypothetical protein
MTELDLDVLEKRVRTLTDPGEVNPGDPIGDFAEEIVEDTLALIAELRRTRGERDGYRDRGRVYEGKVQTLREDLHAALAVYDVSPTLDEFLAAGRGE